MQNSCKACANKRAQKALRPHSCRVRSWATGFGKNSRLGPPSQKCGSRMNKGGQLDFLTSISSKFKSYNLQIFEIQEFEGSETKPARMWPSTEPEHVSRTISLEVTGGAILAN